MLSPHVRKFSDLYASYGLGAVKNILLLTSILPLARTVNLYKLKDFVGAALGETKSRPQSHYKRLIRFFQDWGESDNLFHSLLKTNLRLLRKLGFTTLIMDGTSWRLGDAKVHYLVLSILVHKIAIPLYWVQLGKLGASSQEERKEMFEEALKLFDLSGMTLLADREYVGKEWFKFLKDNKIGFVIRLRSGDYYEEVNNGGGKDYEGMVRKCRLKNKLLKRQIVLNGETYWILMLPNPKVTAEELVLFFLTTLPPSEKTAMLYAKRWKIETMFFNLKSNGFNIEDLNLKDPKKNRLMLTIVATAYILAIREGLKRKDAIPLQRYRDGATAPEVSIFREGLAILTPKCFSLCNFIAYVYSILSPKNHPFFKNVQ